MDNFQLNPRRSAALAYARAGIPVFPCVVGGKRPVYKGSFHNATTDESQINTWWDEADYNIGLEPEAAAWCVIDIDPKNGGVETWAQLARDNPIPVTRTIITPSGGFHLYFYGSLPGSVCKLGPGVDVRGKGSYVLVPPSVIDGRLYREAE